MYELVWSSTGSSQSKGTRDPMPRLPQEIAGLIKG